MRECVDYQVVSIPSIRSESDWVSFSNAVRQMVSDGWEPVGGVSVVANRAVQAMAKYEEACVELVSYPASFSDGNLTPGKQQKHKVNAVWQGSTGEPIQDRDDGTPDL